MSGLRVGIKKVNEQTLQLNKLIHTWIKSLITLYKGLKKSVEYRNVFNNISFLSIIQFGNYFLPLVSLPYLVRILGVEGFGQVMFAQAFVQYFGMIVEYGFNFSATKQISLNRDDLSKISKIFCSVFLLKIIFFLLSLMVFTALVMTIDKFSHFKIIYFLTFVSVTGNLLFPTWLFQGLEKMKYITFVNLSSKIISTICIFIFITKPENLIVVPIINAVSSIVPSTIVLLSINKIIPIEIVMPSIHDLKDDITKGWYVFLSSISSSLYSMSNIFLLGMLFNNVFVGYYSFAERIIRACTSFMIPINSALFPYMSLKMKESKPKAIIIFKKIALLICIIMGLGTIIIFFASDIIVAVINEDFYPSITILKILSPLLLLVGVSNLIGFQILYTLNLEKKFLFTVFVAGLINIALCFALSSFLLYKAAAVSLLISEAFICISFVFFSKEILFE